MHLAEQDITIANNHNQKINTVEKDHIAFRTDNIKAFKAILKKISHFLIMETLLRRNGIRFFS